MSYLFRSERLGFRNWTQKDHSPFIKMNQDVRVMEYLLGPISEEKTIASVSNFTAHHLTYGYTYFATFELESDSFIGFIGLKTATFEADFTPCIDIGWRLAFPYWGKGYATEGARKMLAMAAKWDIKEVFSFTPVINKRSENVMIKSGMKHVDTFDHPKVEVNSGLKKHLLYHINIK